MVTGPEGRRRAVTRAASASVGKGSASFSGPHLAVGNLRVSQTECPPGYATRITNIAKSPLCPQRDSGPIPSLTDAAFEANGEKLLRLDRELHRQLLQHLFAKTIDDERQRVFPREAALVAIEYLVVADLRRRRLVLDARRRVADLDVRHRVGAALIADQQGVALRIIACILSLRQDFDEPTVGVLSASR